MKNRRRLTDYQTPMGETLHQPRVWSSMLLFFLYVGAEASLEPGLTACWLSRAHRPDCGGAMGRQLLGDFYPWPGLGWSVCQTGWS